MKHIQKTSEPKELSDWQELQKVAGVNYRYEHLQNPEKKVVHKSLLTEQGYLCCYCCDGIDRDSSHIEHLDPQSQTNADLSLDYNNILASCGNRTNWPEHCGNAKGDRKIGISPLDPDCEGDFAYTAKGKMKAQSSPSERETLATETIAVLNLNHPDLVSAREGVFASLQIILSGLTKTEVRKLSKRYSKLQNDRYRPFLNVMSYFLRRYC